MVLLEALQNLPREQQVALAGIVAWLITQALKALFHVEQTAKLRKLVTAAVMAFLVALGMEYAGAAELVVNWLGTFAAAIATHEISDKLGVQKLLKMRKE